MKNRKKWLTSALALVMVLGLNACGGEKTPASSEKSAASSSEQAAAGSSADKMQGEINVVSREEGSGTRGAFVEMTKVQVKENDQEVDKTYQGALVQQGTDAVITYVAGDERAIGYISLGSLNNTVKSIKVEGVEASAADIKNGTYKVARPFNIVYQEAKLSELSKDFIDFIFSKKGQALADEMGFIAVEENAAEYANTTKLSGKVTIQGSTSVAPLMEKIIEAYKEVQPDVSIELTQNGSGAGITAATEGNTDIGMASRALKDEEKAKVQGKEIAMDGIAIIVNQKNPTEELTMEQIRQIFTGEVRNWEDL